jgi:GH35 family endo-1,4-beta-xylanase
LHGQFFQIHTHDNDYNLEIFRIAHRTDGTPKLFLNDYNVVAGGWSTNVSMGSVEMTSRC